MARRTWSVERVEEINRYIEQGLSDRQIARAMKCRRAKIREVRELGATAPAALAITAPVGTPEPEWAAHLEWSVILEELGCGFEIRRIWEERAQGVTSYSNFWKYLSRRHGWCLKQTVTLREFDAGTHCEVDWAGDKIPWWDEKGRRHEAHVFVGILCHSQLLFAFATADEKSSNWLTSHEKMYRFFGGVPRVTVPDNLKTGVKKAHLYDPDLNPLYTELARHYGTAVVPARVRRPRDKALVENAVGQLMRLYRWMWRNSRAHSIAEINERLKTTYERINGKVHSRFKTSRKERFEKNERPVLKPLPELPFEQVEWKTATVHPDCTVSVESNYYSCPHIYRGKQMRVKLTARQVEIFINYERVALHGRHRRRDGCRIIDPGHLPPNSQAYSETTPQNILCQARFLSSALHGFINQLFQEDTLVHLRRAQGFIRHAREEISRHGKTEAEPRIAEAVSQCERFAKIKVSFFEGQLTQLRTMKFKNSMAAVDREISRRPGNPMLRHNPSAVEKSQGTDQNQQQEQLSFPPERNESHEFNPDKAPAAGIAASRHGGTFRENV